ncbi:MAG: hypothetical protein EOP56_06485 [Sphingobacteriales bacterium]|nr:MAG: hypothetical protein EOP56_06485 [Sphingobacteriales bacterium]
MSELEKMTVKELMNYNSKIMDELKSRNVIRTRNNPIADYCEWLVSQKFNWNLENSSTEGYDVCDDDGLRVQVKCRTLKNGRGTRQLGVIRKLNDDTFDYLIAILFDEKTEVIKAYKIRKDLITDYARFSQHQNGHILSLKGGILNDNRLEDITLSLS